MRCGERRKLFITFETPSTTKPHPTDNTTTITNSNDNNANASLTPVAAGLCPYLAAAEEGEVLGQVSVAGAALLALGQIKLVQRRVAPHLLIAKNEEREILEKRSRREQDVLPVEGVIITSWDVKRKGPHY